MNKKMNTSLMRASQNQFLYRGYTKAQYLLQIVPLLYEAVEIVYMRQSINIIA